MSSGAGRRTPAVGRGSLEFVECSIVRFAKLRAAENNAPLVCLRSPNFLRASGHSIKGPGLRGHGDATPCPQKGKVTFTISGAGKEFGIGSEVPYSSRARGSSLVWKTSFARGSDCSCLFFIPIPPKRRVGSGPWMDGRTDGGAEGEITQAPSSVGNLLKHLWKRGRRRCG